MQEFTVTADSARKSDTGVDGGVDVDFSIEFADGTEMHGEVTLVPAQYDGRPSSWGAPDNWISGDALRLLRKFDDADFTELLSQIEGACSDVAATL